MKNPIPTNPAVAVTIALIVIWLCCLAWVPTDGLNYVLRVSIAIGALAALTRFLPAAVRVYRDGARDREDSLIIGIVVGSLAFLYYGVYSVLSRVYDSPDWLTDSKWSAFGPLLFLVFYLLVVIAARKPLESTSTAVSWVVGLGAGVALFLATAGHAVLAFIEPIIVFLVRIIPH